MYLGDHQHDGFFEALITKRHFAGLRRGERFVYQCGSPADTVVAFLSRFAYENTNYHLSWAKFKQILPPVQGHAGQVHYPLQLETSLSECPVATIRMTYNDFHQIWLDYKDVIDHMDFPVDPSLSGESRSAHENFTSMMRDIFSAVDDGIAGEDAGTIFVYSGHSSLFKLLMSPHHLEALAQGEPDVYMCGSTKQDQNVQSENALEGEDTPDEDAAYKEARMLLALKDLDPDALEGNVAQGGPEKDVKDGTNKEHILSLDLKTGALKHAVVDHLASDDLSLTVESTDLGKGTSAKPRDFQDFLSRRVPCRTGGGHAYCLPKAFCKNGDAMKKTTCIRRVGSDVHFRSMEVCRCAEWNFRCTDSVESPCDPINPLEI